MRDRIGTPEFPRRQHDPILERELKAFVRRFPEGQKIELEQLSAPSQTVECSADVTILQRCCGSTKVASFRLKFTSQ